MKPLSNEELLDRALEGESAEVKARVRDIVIKLGIHPNDPFFIISIALGHLQTLIEDSPQEWQVLFGSFEEELSEWATTNLKTLSLLTQRTETMERLASSSEQLSSILTDLTQACSSLVKQLPQSNQQLLFYVKQLENSNKELISSLNSIQSKLAAQERQVEMLAAGVTTTNQFLTSKRKKTTSIGIGQDSALQVLACALLVFVVVIIFSFISSAVNLSLVRSTNQRTELLLHKAERLECLAGIKDRESADCQGLLPNQVE
ncbi:MAG: hypothetical protein F6K14_08475 [Symploca sp. SIO2C1]|nr:hypothetical protein [Symploca sp. SIO2C1]